MNRLDRKGLVIMKNHDTKYEVKIVIVLMLLWGFVGFNRIGITYLFPILVKEFGMKNWQAGALVSGTSITWALSSWLGGILGDKYGKRKVLLWFMSFALVVSTAMGGAWNFLSMFVTRDLLGLADGAGWSIGESVVAAESAPSRMGINQSLFSAGYTLVGVGLGAYVVTHLASSVGWRWVFPIFSVFGLIIVIALAIIMRKPVISAKSSIVTEQQEKRNFSYYVSFLKNKQIIRGIFLCIFVLSWLQGSLAFNTLFLTKVKHLNLNLAGNIISIWGISAFVGQLLLPLISDRIGRRPVVFTAAFLAALGVFGGVLAPSYAVLAFAFSVNGFFGWGILSIAMATIVSELVKPEERTVALGITNFFGVIVGTAVIPIVGGIIADNYGLAEAAIIPGIAMLLVVATMFFVPETAPRIIVARDRLAS